MGGASGQAVDVQIAARRIGQKKDNLNDLLAAFTGQPLERIQIDTDRDYFMTTQEALEYGMIDGVKKSLI